MSLFRIIEPMGHNHNQYLPGYPHGQSALVNAKPRQAYKKTKSKPKPTRKLKNCSHACVYHCMMTNINIFIHQEKSGSNKMKGKKECKTQQT